MFTILPILSPFLARNIGSSWGNTSSTILKAFMQPFALLHMVINGEKGSS
jgi:hypothetical protein